MHGDDKGLVIPPALTSQKIVIVPILIKGKEELVLKEAKKLEKQLKKFGAFLDDRDNYTPGAKFAEWELKGIPLRIEIGPKDIDNKQVVLVRRDLLQKNFVSLDNLQNEIKKQLNEMPKALFNKAKEMQEKLIIKVNSKEEFIENAKQNKFILAPFCGNKSCEEKIKEETSLSSRVIPFKEKNDKKCIYCNKNAKLTYFAKSY